MGNQASKVIEKSKEKKEKRKNNRRRSTVTLGRSSMKQGVISGNYDWIDERQEPKSRRQSITEFFVGRKKSLAQEDLREQDRLQRMHYLLKSARKTNTACTLSESMTILDIGTGNGIWALEIATEQPKSTVIGLDIRPPAEPQGKPKNLTFMEADITKPWPLESNSIDFVFQRNMGNIILKNQWQHVLSEMHRVLKQGGFIELVETDLWHHNPGPVQTAFDEFHQSQSTEKEMDFKFTESLNQELEQIFEQVEHRTVDIPIGEWPQESDLKQFGFINKEIQKACLRNRKSLYMSTWGVESEDYDLAVQEMLTEFEEYHGFTRYNSWTAKK